MKLNSSPICECGDAELKESLNTEHRDSSLNDRDKVR